MKVNPNDYAISHLTPAWSDGGNIYLEQFHHGLTKRELFSALAMQGILASDESQRKLLTKDVAHWSVECADALIAVLNKEKIDE